MINKGTEGRVALLTKNLGSVKLRLGFFMLKNPSPAELGEHITLESRRKTELAFFTSERWNGHDLNLSRAGVDALHSFLQSLLETHIEKELPKVRSEIANLLSRSQDQLLDLGHERPTVSDQRMFLSRLSMAFCAIVQSAIDGTYRNITTGFFGYEQSDISHNRLRASIHDLNGTFAIFMRVQSQRWKVWQSSSSGDPNDCNSAAEGIASASLDSHFLTARFSDLISKKEFDNWIMKVDRCVSLSDEHMLTLTQVYRNTRGRELPGNTNNTLLTELYHAQSSRWSQIARTHTQAVQRTVATFINQVMYHVAKADPVRIGLQHIVDLTLQENLGAALEELKKLCDDKMQPITYNHYFTDNIQKAKLKAMKDEIKASLD